MDPIDERTLRLFIENTVAVMTTNPEQRTAWRQDLERARAKAKKSRAADHAGFFEALTAIVDGKPARLPKDNPYASALRSVLDGIQAASTASGTLSADDLRTIIANTVAVMTTAQAQRDVWRNQVERELITAQAQGDDWRPEAELFSTLLALLDDAPVTLSPDHPYYGVLEQIGLALSGQAGTSGGMTDAQVESTIATTLLVLAQPEDLPAWRKQVQSWRDTALEHALADDADWFTLLLALLDGKTADLAPGHRYAQAAEMLRAQLLAQMADGTDEAMEQVLATVSAFVAAPDWDATEAFFAEHQTTLLAPEAGDALAILIGQAHERDDEAAVELLELHATILGVIKQQGPNATFDWIRNQDDLADED